MLRTPTILPQYSHIVVLTPHFYAHIEIRPTTCITPTDCSVLRTLTILPQYSHIVVLRPTFMLILGRVIKPYKTTIVQAHRGF